METKEKTQEEIRFENLQLRHEIGDYSDYPYKSLGSILHWINVYGQGIFQGSETVSEQYVDYHGERVSSFHYNDPNLQMPIFEFTEKYSWMGENQKIYLDGIKRQSEIK